MTAWPWHARLLLLDPASVADKLARIAQLGLVERAPSLWQVELGVLRMWHRILLRSETIGTCAAGRPRATRRARLLHYRAFRLPFLLWERAIAPWDLSGLASSPAFLLRHLLVAHHDGDQFAYDLQILQLYPGSLRELRQRAAAVAAGADSRAAWLQDLAVYEGYHAQLLVAVDRALAAGPGGRPRPGGAPGADLAPRAASDPDISFLAWLRWCARQPPTPAATWAAWRERRYSLQHGLRA